VNLEPTYTLWFEGLSVVGDVF